MSLKLLVLVLILEIVVARIQIEANVDEDKNVEISYSGSETDLITNDDIKSFKIGYGKLLTALEQHLGRRPSDIYLRSPTPWGDLYTTYNWKPVKRVLSVKSVTVKGITMNPIVVMTQDFENFSNQTIKVNTGITHTIENTLTTSWSREKEITVSQQVEYGFNAGFTKGKGITSFSFTGKWGVSEVKTKTEVIGITSGMEVELKPGEAVTAVLSADAGYLELEVVYEASLIGNIAVYYKKPYRGQNFYGPWINEVMATGGIANEITSEETIRFGYHVEGKLTVYDKATGMKFQI